MKRILCALLAAVLLFSLTACGGGSTATDAPNAPTTEPAPTRPAPTVEVVEGQPIEQLDDVNVYFRVTGKTTQLDGLPAYPGISYMGAKEGRYDLLTHIFQNTNAAAFITYLNALEEDGWQQYSNNIIEGTNLFATYTKGEGSVYCYYISTKNRAYIVSSPNQNLEARKQDNQYETICPPLMTQVQLKCEQYAGGMSYVIRLSDGRFIIIDGGYNEAAYYQATELYRIIHGQNVLDKPTIAAWILTHPHSDHIGTATDFLRHFTAEDVEIQQFIYNFPSKEDSTIDEDLTDMNDTACLPTFLLALDMLWPDMKLTICHTGQEYYFADAKIQFLHTIEDYYPQSIASLSSNNVNGASAIFTVEIAGQKSIFLGDSAVDESEALVKMWGNYLKSDIMQASHHCQRGGTVELYQAIDPTIVLAPLPSQSIKARAILSYPATRWLWYNESGNIKEIILSGWMQRTLEMPYAPDAYTEYFSNYATDPWAGLPEGFTKP